MRRKKKTGLLLAWSNPEIIVTLIWVDAEGEMRRKSMPWKRPQTWVALAGWVEDYRSRVEVGYLPKGFAVAPVPHCALITVNRKVVAEWNRAMTLDEIMRIDRRRSA